MRKFWIGLVAFAVAFSAWGFALDIDDAQAGKRVAIKCKATKPPRYKGTNVKCYNPGMWVWVPYWYAIKIGAYPILLDRVARQSSACVGGKPKVVRTVGASSWRLIGQRCAKQVLA